MSVVFSIVVNSITLWSIRNFDNVLIHADFFFFFSDLSARCGNLFEEKKREDDVIWMTLDLVTTLMDHLIETKSP